MSRLSDLPSVERLLQSEDMGELVRRHGRPLTLDALRLTLDEYRNELKVEPEHDVAELRAIVSRTESHLSEWERSSLQPVINATGVILHTNLGRAPLSKSTIADMQQAGESYSNLEL